MQDHQALVDLELVEAGDINDMYLETLNNLKNRKPLPKPARTEREIDEAAKDYYANVRTNVRRSSSFQPHFLSFAGVVVLGALERIAGRVDPVGRRPFHNVFQVKRRRNLGIHAIHSRFRRNDKCRGTL